jgi:hypothetical protein
LTMETVFGRSRPERIRFNLGAAAVFLPFPSFQKYDFGAGVSLDLIQFLLADMVDIDFEVASADTDNPEPGLFFSGLDFAPLPDKYFSSHIVLLSDCRR